MSTLVEKLAASGHLTDAQVERIGAEVESFLKEASEDPELLTLAQEKLAAFDPMSLMKRVGGAALIGAGGAAGLGAYNMAASKIQQIRDDLGKAKHYKQMMESNPEIAESGGDAKMIQNHFNTLYKFNPAYAKDPMVAGAYVSQSMDSARPNLGVLNQMVSARKQHMEAEAYQRDPTSSKKLVSMLSSGLANLSDAAGE